MTIGKKISWHIAAVTAATLLAGAASAHDRDDYYRHEHRYEHHREYGDRYERRDDERRYDRYDDRYYDRFDDRRGREREWHSRHWREDRRIWAPPLSPPWLLEHGFFGH